MFAAVVCVSWHRWLGVVSVDFGHAAVFVEVGRNRRFVLASRSRLGVCCCLLC